MPRKSKKTDDTTVYRDEETGEQITATTHADCGGHGCEECSGFGFTRNPPRASTPLIQQVSP